MWGLGDEEGVTLLTTCMECADQVGKETDFILLSSGICEILQRLSQKGQKIVGLNEK